MSDPEAPARPVHAACGRGCPAGTAWSSRASGCAPRFRCQVRCRGGTPPGDPSGQPPLCSPALGGGSHPSGCPRALCALSPAVLPGTLLSFDQGGRQTAWSVAEPTASCASVSPRSTQWGLGCEGLGPTLSLLLGTSCRQSVPPASPLLLGGSPECGRAGVTRAHRGSRSPGLTAAFARRSPHYACPEVIRVSSRRPRPPPRHRLSGGPSPEPRSPPRPGPV